MDKLLHLISLSIHILCVCGEGVVLMPVELAPIPCNDKAVEKLSRLAVTYINEDRSEGYKFALNRIANVHLHAQVSTKTRGGCKTRLFILDQGGKCLYVTAMTRFMSGEAHLLRFKTTEIRNDPFPGLAVASRFSS